MDNKPKSEHKPEHHTHEKNWYDKSYKLLMFIPIILVIISIIYLANSYIQTGDVIERDVSLRGGTTITLNGEVDISALEDKLKQSAPDASFRSLSDLRTGKSLAVVVESSMGSEELKKLLEDALGYSLTADNSSVEFTGATLSGSFYKQLIIALLISFILMSIVIFVMFKSFVPSMAVIFAAFSDITVALAAINLLEIRISAAGIAAFLMLIGYSVDTDILLTTRALKKTEGTLNQRIFGAFKTGITMNLTALAAVLPAFFIVTGLPDSFRQIFLILALGLGADIFNTWLTNAGIIKWYCERKGIK